MMFPGQMPGALLANPLLSQWIEVGEAGVCIRTGKVELGQGAVTAIVAIAAAQLGLTMANIGVIAGHTRQSPDEGYTVGSMSIEEGGSAIGWAAALARELFATAAAERLGVMLERIELRDGRFFAISGNESIGYAQLRDAVDLSVRCDALPHPSFLAFPDDVEIRRIDFQQKFSQAAFLHDIDFEGLCYGSVLRPSHPREVFVSIDRQVADRSAGVIATVVDGRFVGVVATRLELAAKAVERLRKTAIWRIDVPIDERDAATWISSAKPVASWT